MTPEPITTMILDTIGYTGQQILTKTIMEPSFGDGSFLVSIVQRIIIEGERAGLSKTLMVRYGKTVRKLAGTKAIKLQKETTHW